MDAEALDAEATERNVSTARARDNMQARSLAEFQAWKRLVPMLFT